MNNLLNLLIILFVLTGATSCAQKVERPPNIVLFVSDDHTLWDSGAYGSTDVKTPNIDQLAREGLLFNNAFAGSPTCAPSRSVLYTGLLPFKNGAHGNHTRIKADLKTLPDYLRPVGYRTGIVGKVHVKYPDYPDRLLGFDVYKDAGIDQIKGQSFDETMVSHAGDFLKNQNQDEPFMLVACTADPHMPWKYGNQFGYKNENIKIPAHHVDTEGTRSARNRYYNEISAMDAKLGEILALLKKYQFDENTIVVYTADQGAQWPFAKWSLYDEGIRVPFIIKWPDKIRGGQISDALISHVDVLSTFLDIAGVEQMEELDSRSFLPVLRGNAAEHRTHVFASHTGDGNKNISPMRMVRSKRHKYIININPEYEYTNWIDYVNTELYWDEWLEQSRTDDHAAKVVKRYHTLDSEEYYDLLKDPKELTNLIGSPRYKENIYHMRRQVADWRNEQADTVTSPQNDYGYRGVNYMLYNGTWNSNTDFAEKRPDKTGWTKGFNLHFRDQDENFGVVYDGFIDIKELDDGAQFYVEANDYAKLEVNGIPVFESGKNSSPVVWPLKPGRHPIKVTYIQKNGDFKLDVGCMTKIYGTNPHQKLRLLLFRKNHKTGQD